MRVKLRQPVSSELRWYALLWGPWFLLGGVLFLLAAQPHSSSPRWGLTGTPGEVTWVLVGQSADQAQGLYGVALLCQLRCTHVDARTREVVDVETWHDLPVAVAGRDGER